MKIRRGLKPAPTIGWMIIATLLLPALVNAQVISETQWFFGQSSANLQFDKNGINVYEEDRMNANFGTGGPAVVSDPWTGNLWFYSDGVNVYDASHNLAPGGSGLNGNPNINQSAVVAPHPTSQGLYYLFTNSGSSGINEIEYVLLDGTDIGNGTVDAPLGSVISSPASTGLADPAEGMVIIPSQTQSIYWLITQNSTNYDFRVTRIDATGVGFTQIFPLDTATDIPGAEAAQFDYNPDSALLAVAPKDPNRNILLLNFNDTLGTLSVNRQIRNTGFNDQTNQNVFDVEWSPNGSKLYFSRYGAQDSSVANIYQVDLADSLLNVNQLLNNSIYRGLGLKKGIDNRMYLLYQARADSSARIGRFDFTDSIASQVIFEPAYFTTDFNGIQFPAFAAPNIPSNPFTMDFTYLDSCVGNLTKFFPRVTPVPDNYFWDFGDGNGSNAIAPIHEYEGPSNYTVSLTVSLNGVFQSFSKAVPIRDIDNEVNIGNDTTICIDERILLPTEPLYPDSTGLQFVWNTGETTNQIEVDTAGTYWVEVTFNNGCTGFASIEISEYGVTQTVSNQWYFGEQAGLDFNNIDGLPPPPRAIVDGNQMFSAEGCASISDNNGELLFYTNGSTVWNRDHEEMTVLDTTGGNYLGGDSTAAQGALILPFMDDETMFYIFSAEEVYGDGTYDIRYAIVDMKKDSADGAVILKNLPLAENMVEKITANSFGPSSWLTMHEFGNNNFRVHLVTEQGMGPVTHSPMGEVLFEQFPERSSGYMKFNLGFSRFVNIIPGTNQFEIFDFDFNDGRFSNPRLIETNESDFLYGVEFAGGGQKLYITTPSALMQYDLDSIDTSDEITYITDSKFYLAQNPSNPFGAVQRGPNGVLYIAIDQGSAVHSIDNSNSDDEAAGYNSTGVDLAGATSRLGLPNFTQQIGTPPTPPSSAFINACLGQQTEFVATGTSPLDEYFWTLEDALIDGGDTTLNGENVFYTYPTQGDKIVRLQISNRCSRDRNPNDANPALSALAPPYSIDIEIIDTVTVFEIPEQPIFPDETNLCAADSLLIELWFEDRSDLSFNWIYFDPNAGAIVRDTSRTLDINENLVPPGTLRDFQGWIENADGCRSDTLQFTTSNNRPFVDLGFDQSVCQFEEVSAIDANVTGVTFQWWVNGAQVQNLDTARLQPVNTQTAGLQEYVVRIQEPFFGCTQTDTLQVTIQESPQAVGRVTPPTLCGAQDAILSFDVSTSGSFQYNLEGEGLLDGGAVAGPGPSLDYTGLGAGIYQLDLQNIVTGCRTTQPLIIEDEVPFDLTANNLPDCQEDISLQMTLSGTQLPEFVRIYITDAIGDTIFFEPETTVPIEIFPGLLDGIYNVSVIDRETGCLQADTVSIIPLFAAEEDCQPEIFAPTAFSPNGNGQNEEFFVYPNPFIGTFEIFIYSRWGELVYYSDDPFFKWDGVYKGQILGPATYAYVIKFTSTEQPALGTLTQFGSVTIIK